MLNLLYPWRRSETDAQRRKRGQRKRSDVPSARRKPALCCETLEDRLVLNSTTLDLGSVLGPNRPLDTSEVDFLEEAAKGSAQEVILGGLATQLGAHADVRAFGRRLVADHSVGLADVVPYLQQEGVDLPPLDPEQAQLIQQFASLPGNQFDAQFADFMVADHEQDVAMFEDEIANGTDPYAVSYASMNLPVLEQHLKIALKLQAEYSTDGSSGGGARLPALGSILTNPLVRPADSSDAAFLEDAAMGDQREVLLGGLATQMGAHADVRNFGWRLATDHSATIIGMIPSLQAEGIELPPPSEDDMQTVQQFATLFGNEFERQFADFMVMDHQMDIANFQNEVQNGSDPTVRAYAALTLPILRQHLRIAERLQAEYSTDEPPGGGAVAALVSPLGSQASALPTPVQDTIAASPPSADTPALQNTGNAPSVVWQAALPGVGSRPADVPATGQDVVTVSAIPLSWSSDQQLL